GQVVGINTATAGQGLGFAIPVDQAKTVIERLRRGESAPPIGWLGVQTTDPDDGSRGALIVAVVNGEPADAAGLQEGDLITAVDGTPVTGAGDLGGIVRDHQPGQRSAITVTRNGQSRTFQVTFGTKPSNWSWPRGARARPEWSRRPGCWSSSYRLPSPAWWSPLCRTPASISPFLARGGRP